MAYVSSCGRSIVVFITDESCAFSREFVSLDKRSTLEFCARGTCAILKVEKTFNQITNLVIIAQQMIVFDLERPIYVTDHQLGIHPAFQMVNF